MIKTINPTPDTISFELPLLMRIPPILNSVTCKDYPLLLFKTTCRAKVKHPTMYSKKRGHPICG